MAGLVLSVLIITKLPAIWLSESYYAIVIKPSVWHRNSYGWDTVILGDGIKKTKSMLYLQESVEVPRMGPGESFTGLLRRSVQQHGYWSKDLEYWVGAVFIEGWHMTSCYVSMMRETSAGVLVIRFMSRSQQPPFVGTNGDTGPAHYNCTTGKRN